MTVYLVGAGPGDPGLLTRRGAALLARADVVIHDRLVHPSILELAPPSAELVDVGKRPDDPRGGGGATRQMAINALLVEHGRAHHTVVRLKGGDPFLFGRGGEEVEALTQAGVAWEVVPGVTSAFGVPAAVGIPVTHRGLASSVTVVTGRVGDPTAPGGVDWAGLARLDGTLVVLMGMVTKAEIAAALLAAGKPADTPTAVIANGTTPQQEVVRTTLGELARVDLASPAVIVIGPVVALGAVASPASPDRPLTGRTVLITRAGTRGQGLADLLERAGATVLDVPLTAQRDPSDGGAALRSAAAAVTAGDYRWVILTSLNAVHRFMAELRDARALGSTLVAAVGPATADALRMEGVEPDLVPPEHWTPSLIDAFPDPDPDTASGTEPGTGNRVLYPVADRAPNLMVDGLTEKGWVVDRIEAYRTVALAPSDPALLEQMARADAVMFTSSSAIAAYTDLNDQHGQALPVPGVVVCIGPTTTASAEAAGLANVVTAHGASAEGLVSALVHHLDHLDEASADGS